MTQEILNEMQAVILTRPWLNLGLTGRSNTVLASDVLQGQCFNLGLQGKVEVIMCARVKEVNNNPPPTGIVEKASFEVLFR